MTFSEKLKEEAFYARQEGLREGTIKHIKSLMETMHMSAEEAMDALRIPQSERQQYRITESLLINTEGATDPENYRKIVG